METGSDGGGVSSAAPAEASTESTATSANETTQSAAKESAPQVTKAELRELAESDMDALVSRKVNGKVEKMTVREALKRAELADGAQAKMQQSAQVRKEAERILALAKSDPDEFFKITGLDADQYAEQRLVKKYEQMAMSPEQKKAHENQQKLEKFEAAENQSRSTLINELKQYLNDVPENVQKLPKEQLVNAVNHYREVYNQQRTNLENEFVSAWKETGLPAVPRFGKDVAALLYHAEVQKNAGEREQSLQPKEAAVIVKQNFLSDVQAITGQMDPESIHRLLGESTMKKLREFDVQRVTGAKPASSIEKSPGQRSASKSKTNAMTEQEWAQHFKSIV